MIAMHRWTFVASAVVGCRLLAQPCDLQSAREFPVITCGPVYTMTGFDPDGDGRPSMCLGGAMDGPGGMAGMAALLWDGQTWRGMGTGLGNDAHSPGIVYGMAQFDFDGPGPQAPSIVAGGHFAWANGGAAYNIAQWNGLVWEPLGRLIGGTATVTCVAAFDPDGDGPEPDGLYAGGGFQYQEDGVPVPYLARWLNGHWAPVADIGPMSTPAAMTVFDADGPGGNPPYLYIAAGTLYRWDGSALTEVTPGLKTFGSTCLAVYDTDGDGGLPPSLIVGAAKFTLGGDTWYSLGKWDGQTWSAVTGLSANLPHAITSYDPDGGGPEHALLVAVGEFDQADGVSVGHVAAWDGQKWMKMGTSGFEVAPDCVYVYDPDGAGEAPADLYAGGTFLKADGGDLYGLAKWSGTRWIAPGQGLFKPDFHDAAYCAQLFDDDGPGPKPASLYVGGDFTQAGPIAAANIARWDGNSWSPVGIGTTGLARAMLVHDEDGVGPGREALYVGGLFQLSGGLQTNYIARWDGQAWSGLDKGFDAPVRTLMACDLDGDGAMPMVLVAGGDFVLDGNGKPLQHVAYWLDGGWHRLGSGVDGIARALAWFDEDGDGPIPPALFVGGDFTTAGGQSVNRIARWDGASWAPLSTGFNKPVRALEIFDDDGAGPDLPQLYAAGEFTTAGGAAANHVARWDGASWTDLNLGTGDIAYSLARFDPDGDGPAVEALYVGGAFLSVGPDHKRSEHLAVWDGKGWAPIAGSTSGNVFGLCPVATQPGPWSEPRLWAAGSFGRFFDYSAGDIGALLGCAPPTCYPDFTGDGALDLFDFLGYVNAFNAQDPTADCDADGAFTLFDFLCFVNAFNEGC